MNRRANRPRRYDLQPLGKALDEFVHRNRWAGRLDAARIFDLWDEVAGEEIAAHAKPIKLHGGVLVLAAQDAAWATQLKYLTSEIQARANSFLGPDTVRTVQIVVGSPSSPWPPGRE